MSKRYIDSVKNKTELQRQMDKEKTGVLIEGVKQLILSIMKKYQFCV